MTEAVDAARELQAKGVGTVLVKLGAQGSLLVPTEGPHIIQPAEKVEKVRRLPSVCLFFERGPATPQRKQRQRACAPVG